jgi:hypothetical protein
MNFVCIRESSAGDAIGMLRIMSKPTLDVEACAFFTDWKLDEIKEECYRLG